MENAKNSCLAVYGFVLCGVVVKGVKVGKEIAKNTSNFEWLGRRRRGESTLFSVAFSPEKNLCVYCALLYIRLFLLVVKKTYSQFFTGYFLYLYSVCR